MWICLCLYLLSWGERRRGGESEEGSHRDQGVKSATQTGEAPATILCPGLHEEKAAGTRRSMLGAYGQAKKKGKKKNETNKPRMLSN
jgi:hypothetical protein